MSGKALSLWTNTKILSCSPIHRLPIVWTFTLAVARREPDHLCMLPAATVLIFACAWTKMYQIMEYQFMMLSYHLFRWNFMTVDTDIKFYFPKSFNSASDLQMSRNMSSQMMEFRSSLPLAVRWLVCLGGTSMHNERKGHKRNKRSS